MILKLTLIVNSNFNGFFPQGEKSICAEYTWEFKHQVYLVVVAPLLCTVCDNPMALQLCDNLVGGTAIMMGRCRYDCRPAL